MLSLTLVTAGAILRWAVTAAAKGIELRTVGLILLIVGAIGFVLAAIDWLGWWSWRDRALGRGRALEQHPERPIADGRLDDTLERHPRVR